LSLTLYFDHHMKEQIAEGLRRLGLDVLLAKEDQAARRPDDWLMARAAELGRVICTEDEDYFRLAAQWWRGGRAFPGIIHVDQDEAGIGSLIEDIALIAESYSPEMMQDRIEYVPMK
jgi:hypothetical protein